MSGAGQRARKGSAVSRGRSKLLDKRRVSSTQPFEGLECGCYDMTKPAANPMNCQHCWHAQHDIRSWGFRNHCGRCGKWKEVFDV